MAGNDIPQSGYAQILQGIGAPVTPLNLKFLANWHAAELSAASYNPFNTTRTMPGSGDLGGPSGNGGHPVQIYQNEEQGIQATIQTLQQKQYKDLVAALKSGESFPVKNGQPIYRATAELVTSPWGTHHLVDPLTGQDIGGSTKQNIDAGPEIALPGSDQGSAPGSPVYSMSDLLGPLNKVLTGLAWIVSPISWLRIVSFVLGLVFAGFGVVAFVQAV